MDTRLRYNSLFILQRTHVVESLVQSLAVMEHLDVIEDRRSRLVAIAEAVVPRKLFLRSLKKLSTTALS